MGSEVVRTLLSRGGLIRAVDDSAQSVRATHGSSVEVGALDWSDRSTFKGALEGCEGVFLVRPSHISNMETTLIPFLDAAVERGVKHIVFLSVLGAATNELIPHRIVESHLAACGVRHTVLRAGFFAQNLGVVYRDDIATEARLFLPGGRGRVAFVDTRDIAELAAMIFADPASHIDATYTCTGNEALSFEETARLMTDIVSRPIRYEAASLAGYVRHLHLQGVPLAEIAVQTVLHVGLRTGPLEQVDTTLERLLGRKPRSLATYIRENVSLWAAPSAGAKRARDAVARI